jgi:drug/metabolite transporter (DMT)-like permease
MFAQATGVPGDRGRIGRGLAWSAVGLAIFSGWFVVTRLAMAADLRVWDVVALRFGGGTLVLLPVLLGQCRRLPWRAWREGLILASLWGVPFVLAVALGLRLTSAAHASSVTPGLMPIFAGAFAWAILGERPAARRFAGYSVILTGIVLLIWTSFASEAGVSIAGLAALVAAAAMWAAYTLRLGRSGLTSIQAASLVCFWSLVVYLPVYLLCGLSLLPYASLREIGFQSLYQGVFMSGLAILSYNRAVALLGPVAAAAITALVPVVATSAAQLVLGETPPTLAWLAIGMIGCGVILAAIVRRPATRHPTPDIRQVPAVSLACMSKEFP